MSGQTKVHFIPPKLQKRKKALVFTAVLAQIVLNNYKALQRRYYI